jgi:hypothetical protein
MCSQVLESDAEVNMTAAAKKQTVPVSERALIQRINRALAKEVNPSCLKKTRGARAGEALGTYYTVDIQHGRPSTAMSQGVGYANVDLEKFGRKLGVLQPYEHLEEGAD